MMTFEVSGLLGRKGQGHFSAAQARLRAAPVPASCVQSRMTQYGSFFRKLAHPGPFLEVVAQYGPFDVASPSPKETRTLLDGGSGSSWAGNDRSGRPDARFMYAEQNDPIWVGFLQNGPPWAISRDFDPPWAIWRCQPLAQGDANATRWRQRL